VQRKEKKTEKHTHRHTQQQRNVDSRSRILI